MQTAIFLQQLLEGRDDRRALVAGFESLDGFRRLSEPVARGRRGGDPVARGGCRFHANLPFEFSKVGSTFDRDHPQLSLRQRY
jgi:hypothetical protein